MSSHSLLPGITSHCPSPTHPPGLFLVSPRILHRLGQSRTVCTVDCAMCVSLPLLSRAQHVEVLGTCLARAEMRIPRRLRAYLARVHVGQVDLEVLEDRDERFLFVRLVPVIQYLSKPFKPWCTISCAIFEIAIVGTRSISKRRRRLSLSLSFINCVSLILSKSFRISSHQSLFHLLVPLHVLATSVLLLHASFEKRVVQHLSPRVYLRDAPQVQEELLELPLVDRNSLCTSHLEPLQVTLFHLACVNFTSSTAASATPSAARSISKFFEVKVPCLPFAHLVLTRRSVETA